MIGWFKRVLGRSAAYSDDELAWSERRAASEHDASQRTYGKDAGLQELRGTVDALRSVGPVRAPRSFALTEENLAAAGYSEREIGRVLRPGMRRIPIWQRPVIRQLPLAITALALLVGGYFVLDDIDVLVPDQSASPSSIDAVAAGAEIQVTIERETAPIRMTVAADIVSPTETPLALPQPAATAEVEITVVVEREVQVVREVERLVEVTREVEYLVEIPSPEAQQTVQPELVVAPTLTPQANNATRERRAASVATSPTAEATVDVEVAREVEVERTVQRETEQQATREVARQVAVDVEREVSIPSPTAIVTREVMAEAFAMETTAAVTAEAALSTATPVTSGLSGTVQPVSTAVPDPITSDAQVTPIQATATPAPAAVQETALPRPPTGLTDRSETVTPSPSDTGPVRIWPLAVALALALAGLVAWFELRRRRRLWE